VRPALILLSLPATILSLGLFLIAINALLLGLADWIANIDDDIRFSIDGVGPALLGALIISLVSLGIGLFVNPDRLARDLTGDF